VSDSHNSVRKKKFNVGKVTKKVSELKDMSDTEKWRNPASLLDIVRMISFHSESGRLQISAGPTRGALFFHDGKLVYAHVGSLTGFQAVNAAVSIADAHFSFDPGIEPPSSGALTHSERIILKQFFSIETANPEECVARLAQTEIDWDSRPAPVVPLTDAEVAELSINEFENNSASQSDEMISSMNPEISRFAERAEPSVAEGGKTDESPALSAIEPLGQAALKYSEAHVAGENELTLRRQSANSAPWKTNTYQILPSLWTGYRRGGALAVVLVLMATVAVALVQKLSHLPLSTQVAKQSPASEVAPMVASKATSIPPSLVKQIEPSRVETPEPTQDRQSEPPMGAKKRKTHMEHDATSQNLTGRWKVVNVVQRTSFRSFENLEIGFQLAINQNGRQFTAKGEKVSENGRALPASRRTPIYLTGSIEGDRVEATFFEEGRVRKTNGRFVWRIANAGAGLSGIFVTTAAKSSGKSAATKEL
jgi:hypothetical protein